MRLFALNGTHELGKVVADAIGVNLDALEEREFEGGEHKSRPMVSVREEDVYVLHSLNGDEHASANDKLIRLLFFLATCRENGAARVTAIVPYLAYSRKERQTKPRDPVTTRYVAQLFEAAGVDVVATLDVHNLAAFQNAFRCRTIHLDTRRLFAGTIAEHAGDAPVTIVSPDGGGIKRAGFVQETFEKMSGKPTAFAFMEKRRSEGKVSGDLLAGDIAGRTAFLVDDMISTGTTLTLAAKACRMGGAEKIYALATHGLFNDGAYDNLTDPAIDRILVTDSVRLNPDVGDALRAKIEVISCAPLLAEAIKRLHGGDSISRLLHPDS